MPHDLPRLLRIDEAAERTGCSPDELRQYCATGRLHCDRVGTEWLILESELHLAASLPSRSLHQSGRSVLAIAFGDMAQGRRAFEEIRRRLNSGARDLEMGRLSLDGREYALVAGSFSNDAYPLLESIVKRYGGAVVDDVDEAWTGRWRQAADGRGRDAYG
jgi:excisionase family DNA binding protein